MSSRQNKHTAVRLFSLAKVAQKRIRVLPRIWPVFECNRLCSSLFDMFNIMFNIMFKLVNHSDSVQTHCRLGVLSYKCVQVRKARTWKTEQGSGAIVWDIQVFRYVQYVRNGTFKESFKESFPYFRYLQCLQNFRCL